ncbi:hypothetical protein FOCC_FOCC001763 [Frankliniella occidentalis]|nr:hypothetical protein FOCC_FOCC001763 [Frankliniella occidentalis]
MAGAVAGADWQRCSVTAGNRICRSPIEYPPMALYRRQTNRLWPRRRLLRQGPDQCGREGHGGDLRATVEQHSLYTAATSASRESDGSDNDTGFLSVKKWLLRKKHQIELARKRGWKGYWVCLKGTTLLFYPCDSREGRSVEAAPKHLIIVDGAIMQPIPEHPKRDYIFCLSTAFGDAYLFQAI